ncbi:MAG TPA: hypothetical protein DDZ53_07250 [Firmicutes bacterium]|nr:hypothetical protein [Bacillota bacterium]
MEQNFVLKTIVKYVIYLLVVVFISFALPRLIPGNPLFFLAGDYATDVPSALLKQFTAYYAPDLSLAEQFTLYLKNLAKLDLGCSFYYKTPVIDRIAGAFKWTMLLSIPSLLISTTLAIWIGVRMGLEKQGRGATFLVPLLAVQAVPTFLIAALAQVFLGYKLHVFPASGAYTPGITAQSGGYAIDILTHLLLPLIVLVVSEIPSTAIFAYNSALRIKKEQYVSFAKYLGISQDDMKQKFIIKNIMPEILGKLSIQTITCVTGSLFVEAVFSYPGLGTLLKQATSYRDYPLMQGILLVSCLYGICVNFAFELMLKMYTRTN